MNLCINAKNQNNMKTTTQFKMKSLITGLCLLAITMRGQITLEHTYGSPNNKSYLQSYMVNLATAGLKYAFIDGKYFVLNLYNLDHSIYKSINLPVPTGTNYIFSGINAISEGLFNTDSKIECMFSYFNVTPGQQAYYMRIVNESGTSIFQIDRARCQIVNTKPGQPGGWKIIALIDTLNKAAIGNEKSEVYALPGDMPSQAPPSTGTGIGGDAMGAMIMQPYPNPSQDKITIPYVIPMGQTSSLSIHDMNGKLIRQYNINSNFNSLEISTTDLTPGTYFYSIASDPTQSNTIIIK